MNCPQELDNILKENYSSNRKGLLSENGRRQALCLCLDAVVVVVIQIVHQFALNVYYRCELLQIKQFHETLNSLVVARKSSAVQFNCDTSVPIPPFVLMIDCGNFCFDFLVFVWNIHPFQMVVEGRAGKLSDCEQKGQRELLPQFLNCLRFLRRRHSSSKTKACKFFR